ncbi:hypothetical protein RUM43_010640 [Polyplax serrata]|uniref:Serpin domain-containing protein n=1 Tax=Polyplax serrata TaxID=468196 RepID=A0AAN8P7K3_POLSC
MKCLIILIFATLVVASSAQTAEEKVEEYEEYTVPFNGQKFDAFDWQLCTEVANADPGNVLISPISIKILLNMLYEGSSGETAKELEKKLQLPSDKNLARMKASAVLRSLQAFSMHLKAADPNYVMEIGTKIFVDHSMTPKNWFQRILFLYYNAYIEKLNFTDYKTAVDRVNYWVESVTHGHIRDLISQGNLNHATMLLINAVYFKGSWKSQFQPEETFLGDFETAQGNKKISYMKQTNSFYYSRSPEINAQILRLPYEGQKFAMYIILPEEKNGLQRLIRNVDPLMIRKYIWQMEEVSTEVILPKFKFLYKTDFKPILRKLGLHRIFDSFGEMKGLLQSNKSTNLVVSSVIQKAGIEVGEEGSVAAAASEMQLINKIGIQDELFNATHPFMFFIEDETTGTIVFVGKYIGPETSDVKNSNSKAPGGHVVPAGDVTPSAKRQDASKRTNSTFNYRHSNSPKLIELKQKKIKAELQHSASLMSTLSNRNESKH